VVVVLTSLDIFGTIWIRRVEKSIQENDTVETEEGSKPKIRVITTVALMFMFLFSMLVLGFTLGIFVFVLFSAWCLGYRNTKVLLVSSVLFTAFMYIVFIVIMDSILPQGLIFDMLRE